MHTTFIKTNLQHAYFVCSLYACLALAWLPSNCIVCILYALRETGAYHAWRIHCLAWMPSKAYQMYNTLLSLLRLAFLAVPYFSLAFASFHLLSPAVPCSPLLSLDLPCFPLLYLALSCVPLFSLRTHDTSASSCFAGFQLEICYCRPFLPCYIQRTFSKLQ